MIRTPATTITLAVAFIATTTAGTHAALAQTAPRSITLGASTFEYAESFTTVTAVAIASDGSLFVSDNKDKVVKHIASSGPTQMVGRAGGGPGEYGRPGRIKIIRGDTLVVPDAQAGRLVFFTKDGKAAGIFSVADIPESTELPQALLGAPGLLGADQNGVLYFGALISAEHKDGSPIWRDSITLIRVNRATKKVDVLGRMLGQAKRVDIKQDGKEIKSVSINVNPLSPSEQAVLSSTGQLIIARLDPYRISFVTATEKHDGPVVRTETTRLTDAIKTSIRTRAADRIGVSDTRPSSSIVDWPQVLPPVMPNTAVIDTKGRVWLERPAVNSTTTTYDVIDKAGRLELVVGVAPNERVVAFTTTSVLTAKVQEDGLQVIVARPLP